MADINTAEQNKWSPVYRNTPANRQIYTRQTKDKNAISRAVIYYSGEITLMTSHLIVFELAGDGSFELRTAPLDGIAIMHDGERKKPPVWWINEKSPEWM